MATGTLIAESIRVDATLAGAPFVATEVRRIRAGLSDGQRADGLPDRWTLIAFEVADDDAAGLAAALAKVLDAQGWYADLHTGERSFVVFAGRVFAYARADGQGRAQAEAYARAHGVPEAQIDWP
jgi:hypothetical protein